MSTTKDKIFDIMFSVFYIILFPLQMIPCIMLSFVGMSSPWFWVSCAVGLAAMVTQGVKFPCFGIHIWNMANFMATIFAVIFFNFGG